MSYNLPLIAELRTEAATTRKLLSLVPADQNSWKPHAKSMTLGRLAEHVAELVGWSSLILQTDELNLAEMNFQPRVLETNESLLALLDESVEKAVAALENATDEDFDKLWTMRRGDHIFFTLPKKVVLRTWAYSHMVHHRGQLSVYLRLLNIPIPGMYGPSADDAAAMAAAMAAAAN